MPAGLLLGILVYRHNQPGLCPDGVERECFARAQDALGDVARQLPETRTKHLLAFNEPDHPGQASMSVDEAIRLWPHLQSTGLRLGSPATVDVRSPWLDHFMARARQANLRIDFMTMHQRLPPNPESSWRRSGLHTGMGGRVWVTEFAVADWQATPARPLSTRPVRPRISCGCGCWHASDALRRTVCVEIQGSR